MLCADFAIDHSAVDIFNAISGRWSTAALSVARFSLAATSLPNQGLAIFAGGDSSLSFYFCDGLGAGGMLCDVWFEGEGMRLS